jgi:hypothetical protein
MPRNIGFNEDGPVIDHSNLRPQIDHKSSQTRLDVYVAAKAIKSTKKWSKKAPKKLPKKSHPKLQKKDHKSSQTRLDVYVAAKT